MDARESLRRSPLSTRRMAQLDQENARDSKMLTQELSRLDKERQTKLRELNQMSKHFVDLKLRATSPRPKSGSPRRQDGERPWSAYSDTTIFHDRPTSPALRNGSPTMRRTRSSRSPSPLLGTDQSPPKSRSPSPRLGHYSMYVRSASLDNSDGSPQSPPLSPCDHSPKLLARRCTSNTTTERKISSATVTTTTVTPLRIPSGKEKKKNDKNQLYGSSQVSPQPNSLPHIVVAPIPQIVISTDQSNGNSSGSGPTPAGIPEQTDLAQMESGALNIKAESDPKQAESDETVSLTVPLRRGRSSSMPSLPPAPAHVHALAAKRHSDFTPDHERDPSPVKSRSRSRSICVPYHAHLKDAPRRDSLLRKYTATRSSYRRTSMTIQEIILDLKRSLRRLHLPDGDRRSPPISDEEWASLKKCRYLRMPSKEENDQQNKLDIQEIFSH